MSALDISIKAYIAKDGTLTKAKRAMLARLSSSKEVAEAFATLSLSDLKGFILIRDCVVAHDYANGEHARQIAVYRSAPDPEKARRELARVERFFRGAVFRTIPDIEEVFARLRNAIDDEARLRKEFRGKISRKGDASAAMSRAIWQVKESIRRLSGKSNPKAALAIAAAVLDKEIDANHVKNAKGYVRGQ